MLTTTARANDPAHHAPRNLPHVRDPATADTAPRWHADLRVAAVALLLLVLWDMSGLDLAVARLFAGPGGFPLRENWVASSLLHEGGRAAAWCALALLAVNVWKPWVQGPTQAERWRWLLVTVACIVVVPAFKRASASSCPWDLAEFGGIATYVSHWRLGAYDGGPGHCFPSGHAVSAFGFLCGWFALRDSRPRVARMWLGAVIVLGIVFGGAQLVRGAHYVSHTLWTGWLCWVACSLAYMVSARRWPSLRRSHDPMAHPDPIRPDAA
jgi:membrane-associated PAP2 superfamily phosphatase